MSSINSSNGSVFPAKRPRTTRRVWAVLLSTGLLSGTAAVAEVVTVPTADGGEWQMTIAPQGTKFDYPASLRVAMQIKPGEHIGIVGASGSGKSTLLRSLLGLEKLESGSVKVDGVDLALLDAAAIRRQIGVVGQAGRLFPGTLFENISAGLKLSEDEVWTAVRLAALEDDIRALPLGLSTPIGDAEPILSIGQIQRVLLARALAHRPALVVLDEATSALDPKAEAHVAASVDALKATVITVAHRLDTVRRCDRIYVLKDGRIAETGTFDQLAASDGILAEFLSADARSLRQEIDPVGDSIRRIEREFAARDA